MALNLEYYVYGDFETVVTAFKLVSSVFHSHLYLSWFTVVILYSTITIFFHGAAENALGGKFSDTLWAKNIIYGVVLYSIFIVPTVTMHIYDPVKNRYEAVGEVPVGVGLVAGLTSMATREINEIIETAGNPIVDVDFIGFGDGFEMLASTSMIGNIGAIQDPFLAKTVYKYIENCFDQAYASGEITDADMYNSSNLLNAIALDYRVFYSDVFDDAHPGGQLLECADAYANIKTRLVAPVFTEKVMTSFCSKLGYDTANSQEYISCKNKFGGMINAFGNNTGSTAITDYIASSFIARQYLQGPLNAGVETAKEIAKGMATASDLVGSSLATQYIPKLQGMVATILISIFIIVALFYNVAPAESFKFYIGLWLWLMLWTICDTISNVTVQNLAYKTFLDIRESNLGLNAMFITGKESVKVLGMFGQARWMSMSLASLLAVGLFKVTGGSVFAGFTRQIGASYQQAASSMGAQIATPGDQAALHNKLYDQAANDIPTSLTKNMANFNTDRFGYESKQHALQSYNRSMSQGFGGNSTTAGGALGDAASVKSLMDIGYSQQAIQALGGSGYNIRDIGAMGALKDTLGKMGMLDAVNQGKVSRDDLRQMGEYGLLTEQGRTSAAKEMSTALGMDYNDVVKAMQTNTGMQGYFQFKGAEKAAKALNMETQDVYQAANSNTNVSLSDEQAKAAGLSAGAGAYSMSFDEKGNVVSSHIDRGSTMSGNFETLMVQNGKELIPLKNATIEGKGKEMLITGTDQHGNKVSMLGYGNLTGKDGNKGLADYDVLNSMTADGNRPRLSVTADGKTVGLTGAKLHNENGTFTITGQSGGKSRTFVGTGDFDNKGGFIFKETSVNSTDVDKHSKTDLSSTYDASRTTKTGSLDDSLDRTVAGKDVQVLDRYTEDSTKNYLSGTKKDSRDTDSSGTVKENYNVNREIVREGMDYDAGSNYKNVFQGGLDKKESENLAEAAWGAAWNKDSSWVTGKDGKRHVDWNAFGNNLAAEVRQQTGDMNSTIGSFLKDESKVDHTVYDTLIGKVTGSFSAGTPGAVTVATGYGFKIDASVSQDWAKQNKTTQSRSANDVYRTIQNDHLKAIDSARNSDGSINQSKFISGYSGKLNETATNYDKASRQAPSEPKEPKEPAFKAEIPKAPAQEREPMKIPSAPKGSMPSPIGLYSQQNNQEATTTPSMSKPMPGKRGKK